MSAHSEWKAFKSRHPNFEKLKGYKGNFGPQLDQAEKAAKQMAELDKQYKTKMQEVHAIGEKIVKCRAEINAPLKLAKTALEEYEKAINASNDKNMIADFQKSKDKFEIVATSTGSATMDHELTITADSEKKYLKQVADGALNW